MPKPHVAQPKRGTTGRRYGAHDWQAALANWRIEDVAKLRLFRANRTPHTRDLAAFAASIGRSVIRVKAVLCYLPEKPCFASTSVIDDGPLTFAERMALIWETERKR